MTLAEARAEALHRLLEAEGAMSIDELAQLTGWAEWIVCDAVERLVAAGRAEVLPFEGWVEVEAIADDQAPPEALAA